jgi:predicted AAA+ superfamily ATPase
MRNDKKQRILEDLQKKMVFVVGPRQVGKTWLAKEVAKQYQHPLYLNYDSLEDRKVMLAAQWLSNVDLVILDELHKMPNWKNYLKGVYDTRPVALHILVTGSARLETFRQAGDSLAGRFFVHHLLPLTLKDLLVAHSKYGLDRLLERGGFPEPFLTQEGTDAERWRKGYKESLLREDIYTIADVDKLLALKDVFEALRVRVGSPLSYAAIAGEVGISPATVKRYVQLLRALYIVYTLPPFTKKITRAIRKEEKLYFYDTGLVRGDEGIIFENMVSNALLEHVVRKQDEMGFNGGLFYLRDKEQHEVDFVLTDDANNLAKLIEAKLSDSSVAPSLSYFSHKYAVPGVQVVKNIRYGKKYSDKIEIQEATQFLLGL